MIKLLWPKADVANIDCRVSEMQDYKTTAYWSASQNFTQHISCYDVWITSQVGAYANKLRYHLIVDATSNCLSMSGQILWHDDKSTTFTSSAWIFSKQKLFWEKT